VSAGGPETDLFVNGDACSALRVRPLSRPKSTGGDAAKLERGAVGGLGGLDWTAVPRTDPAPQEVEIEVEASGLNFRDVMWALSLLPDEVLEDGFAGPTLGLECAGTVRRIGSAVSTFKPGDRVVAFAPSAFSTHVNVPSAVVMPIAEGTDTEAACDRAGRVPDGLLRSRLAGPDEGGEWVLIHGAAGGVGMAAVQIAQWRGANIIATAGSDAKRHLLRSLGVEHVLNSRSSGFADEVRRIVPAGVDIVLNSLSGEAMERGLSALKAFGRFIELGKRDYVANTHIGLRPFRRNLSYFGVDVDQLLSTRTGRPTCSPRSWASWDRGLCGPCPTACTRPKRRSTHSG
jgi:NADPH:quinone reductase-like Zn-dependent oxidoreductase